MRRPMPSLFIGIAVIVGAFFKRYLITIPTLLHPHLPAQNYTEEFTTYWPTAHEWTITMMAVAGAVLYLQA